MTTDELIKAIKKAGWKFDRMGKGNCRMYRHPDYNYPIPIHYHRAEVGKSLANKILKQAGVK